jgi:sugar diacid utilization regulator
MSSHPGGSSNIEYRQAAAAALINGGPADNIAARANIRLARSYVVTVVKPAATGVPDGAWDEPPPDDRPRDLWSYIARRPELLPLADGDDLVLLLPAFGGIPPREIRELASEMLRHGGTETACAGVAASYAKGSLSDSVEEARTVLHIARTMGYPAGVYLLSDVAVEASLMRSPDLGRLLALRLTPLQSSEAPLMETLGEYLRNPDGRIGAAAALHIHVNTLDYRLRRIRQLTGLSPALPRDIQVLGASLAAWRLLSVEESPA